MNLAIKKSETGLSEQLWQRLGAATGILYVVLLMVGISIIGGSDEPMTAEARAQAFAEAAGSPTTVIGFSLLVLAFCCFLFFLGKLSSVLRRAEGENGWLSTVVFAGGLMSLTIKLGSSAFIGAAFRRANEGLDPQMAQVLQDMDDSAFLLSFLPLVVLLIASAIVTLRYGGLPRWLGWMGTVVAAALWIGATIGQAYWPDASGLPFLLFLLWTLITSIVLVWHVGRPVPSVSNAPVSSPPAVS